MSISFQKAAEGRAEMAFWPVAAAVYIFADFTNGLNFLLIGLLTVSGSFTYLFLRHIQFESGRTQGGDLEIIDAVLSQLPQNPVAFLIIALGILSNFLVGLYLLFVIGSRVFVQSDPNIASVGLLVLPLLYLSMFLSASIWNA